MVTTQNFLITYLTPILIYFLILITYVISKKPNNLQWNHWFFKGFEVTKTRSSLIVKYFLKTHNSWWFFIDSNNRTTLVLSLYHIICTDNRFIELWFGKIKLSLTKVPPTLNLSPRILYSLQNCLCELLSTQH
jgi:hypothetical protein